MCHLGIPFRAKVVCARGGNLNPLGCRLVMTVIGPLLVVVTVGSTVSTKMLQQEGWVLIVWSFIFMTVCFLVSCGVAAAARIKPAFRDEFVLAATFPNALAAPLVMMTTLCRQPPFVNGDYRAEPGDEEVSPLRATPLLV